MVNSPWFHLFVVFKHASSTHHLSKYIHFIFFCLFLKIYYGCCEGTKLKSFHKLTMSCLQSHAFFIFCGIIVLGSHCYVLSLYRSMFKGVWVFWTHYKSFFFIDCIAYIENYLHVHPLFLHSNAISHKWVFGGVTPYFLKK